MSPYDEEFTRLKAGDETRRIARSLYVQASERTKRGSGRSLGQGQNALSAVCAFLASTRLGNGEVTRDQARAVACVDPKTFDSTLAIVESVLRPSRSSAWLNQTNITYRSLSKQHVAREDAYVPMVEVEQTLKRCEAFMDGSPIDLGSSLMQCAIFYWVCTVILNVAVPDATYLRQMLKVSPKTWSASQRVLENNCSHMTDDLTRKAETALSARASRPQMRTATKENVRPSLTDSIARPGKLSLPLTPPKTPLVQMMKPKVRVVAFDSTPTTLTGMCDTPPPTMPKHSRAVVRTRLRAPGAAKGLSYPIQEEMPRRRRRNICAGFLNPDVYGWKPAAHTARKLERARNWESLMIGKYGDPWDAW